MKNGMTALTTPLILALSILLLTVLTIFIISLIIPFIKYQKLDQIVSKYMFVIERFGYLTEDEYSFLKQELLKEGFETQNIEIIYPKHKLEYGTLFEFSIKYNYNLSLKGRIKEYSRTIPIIIKKYAYSKI